MEARSDRGSPGQPSSNPIVVELSKPETLTDSERQLRLTPMLFGEKIGETEKNV